MKNTVKLLLAIVLFASCNQYEKTPTGLAYKITKGNGKEKLKNGDKSLTEIFRGYSTTLI